MHIPTFAEYLIPFGFFVFIMVLKTLSCSELTINLAMLTITLGFLAKEIL